MEVADRLHHHQRHRRGGGGVDLAGRGLDEVRAGRHRQDRGAADVVVGAELARLQDHLEVRLAGRLLDGGDLVVDLLVVTAQEGAAVDDHVHLVGARRHRLPRLGKLHLEEALPRWKGGRDAGDPHLAPPQVLDRDPDHRGVDADRRHARDRRVAGVGPDALGAERRDLAGGVCPLQRGQVHHPDRQLQRPDLRRLLDRPLAELGRPRLDGDLVDGAHAAHQGPEMQQRGDHRHAGEITPRGAAYRRTVWKQSVQ